VYRHNKNKRTGALGTTAAMSSLLFAVWAYADLQNSVSVATLTISATAIPFVNEPSKNDGDKKLPVSPTPLYVELDWGENLPHDLDLWISCYQETGGIKSNALTIGYKRTSQGWMDLLRDDLGAPSPINKEVAQANSDVSRVPPNVFCQFNVHLYHSHGGALPVKGVLNVIQDKDSQNQKAVASASFEINEPGQEITAVSARWDERGDLIASSVQMFPEGPQLKIATGQQAQE
jgi:hypothetical protein